MSYEKISGNYTKDFFNQCNGFTRQNISKKIKHQKKEAIKGYAIIELVKKQRAKHKNMGARVLYHKMNIKQLGMGINKFEQLLGSNGLSICHPKKRIITTQGVYQPEDYNMVNGLKINNINQVISGDITYYLTPKKPFYIYILKDMYSKRILAMVGSDTMKADNTIKALKQVINQRGKKIEGCIHHSDAGGQYKASDYKKLLNRYFIKQSIAENCLQNGMAEQRNGVLKNDYLPKGITTLKELNKEIKRAKQLINNDRPVKKLGYKTPIAFEKWIENLDENQRPIFELYDFTQQKGEL